MLLDETTTADAADDSALAESETPTDTRDGSTLLATAGATGAAFLASGVLLVILPGPLAMTIAAVAGVVLGGTVAGRLTAAAAAGLAWYAAASLGTVLVLQVAETHQNNLAAALAMTALVVGLPAVGWVRVRTTSGDDLATAVAAASRVFVSPRTGIAAALIGAGLALPLIGTYAPVISDPDSAWFVTSTRHVQQNGIGLLQDTHDVFLPHLTIGPLITIGGYQAAIPFMILTTIGLCALAAYLGYRLTGHGGGALAAAAVLLSAPVILERADRLQMYAAAFLLAHAAGWILHRAMAQGGRPWWWAAAGGAGFVLAYEAHGVGQVFLLVPFLLLLLHPWARARRPFAIALATIVVLSIPRIIVNLSVDGLADFRTNYADFMVQDHLSMVNRDFWGHNNDTSPLGYLTNLPEMARHAVGGQGMILLLALPIVLAAARSGRRARLFVAASAVVFIAALAVNSPATFGRYLAPLMVGLALVAAVGVVRAMRGSGDGRLLGRALLVILVFASFLQMETYVSRSADARAMIEHGPWPDLVAAIDDDRAVIGVRPHQLVWADPSVPTVYARTMTEADWVTYLSWPEDDTVLEMFDRNDVGWVYVMPDRRFEVDYHQTWLEPVYDLDVRHVERVEASDALCLAAESVDHLLYRVGECEPGDVAVRPDSFAELFYAGVDDASDATGDELLDDELLDDELPDEELPDEDSEDQPPVGEQGDESAGGPTESEPIAPDIRG